jgi:hypothetical protein
VNPVLEQGLVFGVQAVLDEVKVNAIGRAEDKE